MEPQNWTIGKVVGITDTQYGKKFNVYLNGYNDEVSGFTKWPEKIVEGGTLYGHIELKGQYRNFKFDKKAPQAAMGGFDANDRMMLGAIYNWVQRQKTDGYPEPGVDDIDPKDVPF